MKNTLLISYKTLTQSSELNENIDTKIILPLIKEVQEIEILTTVGETLFLKLQSDIESEAGLAGNYKILVDDFIKPVLINAILADLPFKLNYRFTNIGMVTRTAENSTTPEFKEVQKLSDYYKAKKVWHSNKMTAYLFANTSLFPEFLQGNGNGQTPKKETYDVSIYL